MGKVSHPREYVSENVFRGVVLFSHAEHSGDLEHFFEDDENANAPVLYLCGDSHYWDIEEGKHSWSEFTSVSVDRGACADPLLIEVAPVIEGETHLLKVRAVVSILLAMVSFESIVRVVGTLPRNVGSDCLLLHYGIRWLQIDRLMLVSYGIRLSTWIKRNANR
jgi:hypothetical protein